MLIFKDFSKSLSREPQEPVLFSRGATGFLRLNNRTASNDKITRNSALHTPEDEGNALSEIGFNADD
jgi:hypothetical protein